MPLRSRFRIHKQVAADLTVEVSEKNGVRCLHLGSSTVQSAMRLSRPNELELSYTRCMMAFLLFRPLPRQVAMIGLGGGSLAKFVYHHMPQARILAVEVHPQVVAAARQYFFLPDDPERLDVVIADGAEHVRSLANFADVLLVDGYASDGQAPELATLAFYESCARVLKEDGVMVTNLFVSEPGLDAHLRQLEHVFAGRVLCLADEHRGNLIVMGFATRQDSPNWKALRERARDLEARYGLEFPRFVDELKGMNPHDRNRLFV